MNFLKPNQSYLLALVLSSSFALHSCGGSSKSYTEEERVELTKGLITELKEVEQNKFKICRKWSNRVKIMKLNLENWS